MGFVAWPGTQAPMFLCHGADSAVAQLGAAAAFGAAGQPGLSFNSASATVAPLSSSSGGSVTSEVCRTTRAAMAASLPLPTLLPSSGSPAPKQGQLKNSTTTKSMAKHSTALKPAAPARSADGKP